MRSLDKSTYGLFGFGSDLADGLLEVRFAVVMAGGGDEEVEGVATAAGTAGTGVRKRRSSGSGCGEE